jgi:hypothetical protein
MRKPLLWLLLPIIVSSLLGAEPPDFKALVGGLGKTPRQHPYLIFSAEEKPAMLQRIQADPKSAETYERIRLEGRRLLYATAEREAPARIMHTRYVGADDYQKYVSQRLDAAFTLAFLYQMTGDTAYVGKAFEHAEFVCAQQSWIQTAHSFEVIYPRVWPYGAKDDQVVFSFDITASGICQRMAYIYDWLYSGLSKPQRDRIRGALLEKGIIRVRGNYEYLWWATAYKCNWSGICHSGLGLAALALLDEDPQLTDVVARSCEGVWNMLEHVGSDGGWQEGRGYWAYGVGESLRLIDAVKRATGGKLNLFQHRSLYPHPVDFALYGLTGGFGDGSGNPVGSSFVINKLVQESGDPQGAWYAKNYVSTAQSGIFDLLWPATTVAPVAPTEASKFFPSIDWAFLRRDFNPDSVTIATKAGMNDDPHHGHLDIGTFNLTWQNLAFVGEVPRVPYDEQYFSAMRWDYLQARTAGHNVVMVNGEEQICAKLKDEPWKPGIGGKITHYQSEPTFASVIMDPTHAYPGKELHQWQRAIVLDKAANIVVVLDRVNCAVGAKIEVRFHTGVDAEVTADRVSLRPAAPAAEPARGRPAGANRERPATKAGEHRDATAAAPTARARTSGMEMQALFAGEFTLTQGRQPDLPVTMEPSLSWAPYFSTVVKAPAADNVIASVFYPADLRNGDQPIVCKLGSHSGTPTVTYTYHGKTITVSFAGDRISRTEE